MTSKTVNHPNKPDSQENLLRLPWINLGFENLRRVVDSPVTRISHASLSSMKNVHILNIHDSIHGRTGNK